MEPTIENWLDIEFNHAKYSKNSWGRLVIQAIDMDDHISLYNCMKKPNVDINTQFDMLGYAQYLWTSSVHKYFGDTALHFAMRQKKMMCVHILLIMKARFDIPNKTGETADSLSLKLFGTSAKNLKYEAYKFILNRTPLKDISKLPDSIRYRNIEKEAWKLMEEGRILYSELPKSFGGSDPILDKHLHVIRRDYLSFNLPPKPVILKGKAARLAAEAAVAEAMRIDEEEKEKKKLLAQAEATSDWIMTADGDGNQYYYNQVQYIIPHLFYDIVSF